MELEIKNRIKNHFFYKWIFYAIFIVVASLLTAYITNLKVKNRQHEIVSVFSAVPLTNKAKLSTVIENGDDNTLREVKILDYEPNDPSFGTIMTTAGTYQTDIIILPKEKLSDSFVSQYTFDMSNNVEQILNLGKNLRLVDFFTTKRISAIEIYNEEDNYSIMNEFFTYKKDGYNYKNYYLFFNKTSVNFKEIFVNDNENSNHATIAIKNMLKYQ